MSNKVGIVIFNDDCTEEGLAALHWASDSLLSMKPQLHILFIKVDKKKDGSDEPAAKIVSPAQLYIIVDEILTKQKSPAGTNDRAITFDDYVTKFGIEELVKSDQQGLNIQQMMQGAIKKFQLDTLVIGMEALRKTCTAGRIDLQLDSECSVVLVKKDPKAMMLTMTTEDKKTSGGSTSEDRKNNNNQKNKQPKKH